MAFSQCYRGVRKKHKKLILLDNASIGNDGMLFCAPISSVPAVYKQGLFSNAMSFFFITCPPLRRLSVSVGQYFVWDAYALLQQEMYE